MLAKISRAVALLAISIGLTCLFWPTLWAGGGLVGGDVYYYFLPQKAFFADRLREGGLPWWNPLVGNGYPQVAESQTGAFYPPHWPLYRWLSLNAAFNTTILAHYAWAFLGCYWLGRCFSLTRPGALFAALVYTYSWFPPRVSLEWAIVGGSWLPWVLGCGERWLRTGRSRWLPALATGLGLQLLAGHFLMAFLTQLALGGQTLLRLSWEGTGPLGKAAESVVPPSRKGLLLGVLLAGVAGFLLAAVQLLPTWELKSHSQRVTVSEEHNPDYGHIPLAYYCQIVAPWKWYSSEQELRRVADPNRARTNWVEAHLYFGLLPLALAVWGSITPPRAVGRRLVNVWLIGTLSALLYTTGWIVPLTNDLPGFSYFEGPGRYGVLCTLGVALLAGGGFDALGSRLRGLGILIFWVLLFGGTGVDLWLVSRMVGHAESVGQAPVSLRDASPLGKMVPNLPPTRMLNEGKGLPSIVGVGTYPVYLGLGPRAYFDPELSCPQPWPFRDSIPTAEQLSWMRRYGLTHVLSLTPLKTSHWPVRQVWFGPDPCLNAPLGRPATSGFFLYELQGTRGRIAWQDESTPGSLQLRSYTPERVVVETESPVGGTLVLTDLAYPGWQVFVNDRPADSLVVEGALRGVVVPPGRQMVEWIYQPTYLYSGLWMTGLGAALAVGLGATFDRVIR